MARTPWAGESSADGPHAEATWQQRYASRLKALTVRLASELALALSQQQAERELQTAIAATLMVPVFKPCQQRPSEFRIFTSDLLLVERGLVRNQWLASQACTQAQ